LTGKRFGPKITGMTTVRFGAFELAAGARELWRDGRRVHVAPQAMRILIELTAVAGEVVTRDHLRSALWPDGTYVDFERSLNTAVRKLRVALGDDADGPRYVQTVPGRGYRFIAPITFIAPSTFEPREPRARIGPVTWRVALPGGIACVAVSIVVMLGLPPIRTPLVIRAVGPETNVSAGDRALLDATVASLQVLVGRLEPSRLIVSDNGGVWRRACHEMTVSSLAPAREAGARLTIRLRDACRDEQLWATTADVMGGAQVDAGVLRAAGRAVADRLLGGEQSARDAAATLNGAALEIYRRGQAAARAGRIEDLGAAVETFENALRLDPTFGPAWAALARTRATRAVRDGRERSQFDQAHAEATHALALDADLADAHVALGQVRFARDRDFGGADAWLSRARALGATAGRDVLWHACVLNAQGRFDAALLIVDEAIAREPEMAALHAWRGLLLHALRRYDDELVALRRAAAMDPQSAEAAFHLGMGYARRRQYDLALPALRRAVTLSGGGGYYLSWYGRMAADAGDLRTAEHVLHELQGIARTRGLAPALSDAVSYHIGARRHRSDDL
jgi:DNA-binding winged helix-turn-helix (wHTH) protein/tetratricopeptide (TPR) repeat protein